MSYQLSPTNRVQVVTPAGRFTVAVEGDFRGGQLHVLFSIDGEFAARATEGIHIFDASDIRTFDANGEDVKLLWVGDAGAVNVTLADEASQPAVGLLQQILAEINGSPGTNYFLSILRDALTQVGGIPDLSSLLSAFNATLSSGTTRQKVEPLGKLGASHSFSLTTASAEVTLTPACRRVRLTTTVNADYRIGTGAIGPAVATDHVLLAGTSIDLCVDANSKVAAIRDATATANGLFAITELVEP